MISLRHRDHGGRIISTTDELAELLDGSGTSFTGQLLALVAKADPDNRAKLGGAYPVEVTVYDLWMATYQPTETDVRMIIDDVRRVWAYLVTGGRA